MNNPKKIINSTEKTKEKEIRKEKIVSALIKKMNVLELVLVCIFVFGVLLVAIITSIWKKELKNGASDVIVALLSFGTLGFSIIHNKLSDKQRYVIGYCGILLFYGILLLVSFAFAIFCNNLTDMASSISLICLIVSSVIESAKIIIEVRKGEKEKEKARDDEISKRENSGLYSKN